MDGEFIAEPSDPIPIGHHVVIPIRPISCTNLTRPAKPWEATEICWYVRGYDNTLAFHGAIQCETKDIREQICENARQSCVVLAEGVA